MSTNCSKRVLKGSANNISAPYLGGVSCKLLVTNTAKRFTVYIGRTSGGVNFDVTIKIEGDGYFTDSSGNPLEGNLRKEIVLPDGSEHHWYTASGEAYLHILPVSNLGGRLALPSTLADFDLKILKDYEREDNVRQLSTLEFYNTYIYGDIANIPSSVTQVASSKYMYGNLAEMSDNLLSFRAVEGQVPVLSYNGTRSGSGVSMIVCNGVELGDDFDNYIKDCANCDFNGDSPDIKRIKVYGTTSYDTDVDVQNAVSTVLAKGVTSVTIIDSYGNERVLGV